MVYHLPKVIQMFGMATVLSGSVVQLSTVKHGIVLN